MDNINIDTLLAAFAKALAPHIKAELEQEVTAMVERAIDDTDIDDRVSDIINMGTLDISFRP